MRWDIPENPPAGNDKVEINTDMMQTLGPPTHLMIMVTKPFQLWFSHPDKKKGDYERWPIDPLPMGIPIRVDYAGWEKLVIRPKLLPAQIRMYIQRAEEVVL